MRTKIKHIAPRTREDLEAIVGKIAELKNTERTLKAQMDQAMIEMKARYEAHFGSIKEKLAALLPQVEAWAESHPEEFGKARSLELLHGVIGWRTNTPSLKTLSGWTWDRVLERLNSLGWGGKYIRTKEEVNKAGLLGDRDALGADGLREVGVRVVQEEEFFVEPKLTDTEIREVV